MSLTGLRTRPGARRHLARGIAGPLSRYWDPQLHLGWVRLPLPPLDLSSQRGWAEPALWACAVERNETTRWGRCTGPGLRKPLALTNHWGLDEAPRVGLWNVRLEDARSPASLIHAPKHVDLAAAHGGRRRVHCLRQRGHGLPLVGDGVVPAERGEKEPRSKWGRGHNQGSRHWGTPSASCPGHRWHGRDHTARGPWMSHSRPPRVWPTLALSAFLRNWRSDGT